MNRYLEQNGWRRSAPRLAAFTLNLRPSCRLRIYDGPAWVNRTCSLHLLTWEVLFVKQKRKPRTGYPDIAFT
jgi:hypothetical protein